MARRPFVDFAQAGREMRETFQNIEEGIIEEVEQALLSAVQKVEADAKLMAPIDKGTLRNSIGIQKEGFADFKVGTVVPYARFVEEGTIRNKPQPFLKPSVNKNRSDIRQGITEAIRRGMD